MQTYLLPELKRRYDNGTLRPNLIQEKPSEASPGVFTSPTVTLVRLEDNRPPRVSFDGDANFGVEVKMLAPKNKIEQGKLKISDGRIVDFRFVERDPNSGWIVMINQGGDISLAFNHHLNGALAKSHLKHARGFIKAADFAATNREPRVALENLFHAIEKTCKAELMTRPHGWRGKRDDQPMAKIQHDKIRNLYKQVGRSAEAMKLYERIASYRSAATYHRKEFNLSRQAVQRLIASVSSVEQSVRSWLTAATRTPVKKASPAKKRQ